MIYNNPKQSGKWVAQLKKLKEMWLAGKTTMSVNGKYSLWKLPSCGNDLFSEY